MRANREAFERRRLRPRMLIGNTERDLSVEVLGTRSPAPFLLAPIGVLSIAHEDGELAVARAAAATGVPFFLSSAASSLDRGRRREHGRRAALVPALLGQRPRARRQPRRPRRRGGLLGGRRHARHADPRLAPARPPARATSRSSRARAARSSSATPSSARGSTKPPEEDVLTAAATMLSTFPHLALTWADLAWLRELHRAADARQGRADGRGRPARPRAGVDGIIVLEPRRPPGGRRGRGARRARRGARRRRRRRDGADGRRHPRAARTSSRRSRLARTPCSSAGRTPTGSPSAARRASRR